MLDNETLITVVSALVAAISFAVFALTYLNKEEKKERYRDVIEKRRKALFEASRERTIIKDDQLSGADSMAGFYKVKKLGGDMAEKIRDKCLQAGIRNPTAPLKFMIAQAVVPMFLCAIAMMFISGAEKELSHTTVMLILFGAIVFGYKLPDILIKNQVLKRQEEINLTFPDALDMMLICVQGGIGLEQTVDRVAAEVAEHSPILAEELGILSAEMAMLNDRRQALQDFGRRVGSGAGKSFATALIQAGQAEEALPMLHEMVALAPGNSFPVAQLARYYEANGQPDMAQIFRTRLKALGLNL